jgi:hypothetical protein
MVHNSRLEELKPVNHELENQGPCSIVAITTAPKHLLEQKTTAVELVPIVDQLIRECRPISCFSYHDTGLIIQRFGDCPNLPPGQTIISYFALNTISRDRYLFGLI